MSIAVLRRFAGLAIAGAILGGCAAGGPKPAAELDPNSAAARAALMQPAVTRLPPKPVRPPREKLCLSESELQAEEVIQFHSRLMVVALTCRSQRADVDLYRAYMEFTERHQDVIRRSEQVLIDRLRRSGWANPAPRFDNWRSKVANELSIGAAKGGLRAFCTSAADEILEAAKLAPGEFTPAVIPASYAMPGVDAALCSAARPAAAKAGPAAQNAGVAAARAGESKPKAAAPAPAARPAAPAKPAAGSAPAPSAATP